MIFTSDNGGERYSYNWPFSFQKMYLWEGGTRVPAMVRWPGVIPAGQVTEQAAITMDWTATILAAAGATADPAYPLDGEDLLPVCTGGRDAVDRTLFWRTRASRRGAVGSWKYLKDAATNTCSISSNDPGEKSRPAVGASRRVREDQDAVSRLERPDAAEAVSSTTASDALYDGHCRTLREAGAGARPARCRLCRCLLWPA